MQLILTRYLINGSMGSNFFIDNWAWVIIGLIWANFIALLAQIDIIPDEAWSQYPLILIGVVLVGWLARYYVANEREWRAFVVTQQQEQKADQLRVLQLIQSNNEQLILLIEKSHKEQLELQRDGQRETFDAALERILDARAYDNQPTRRDDEHRR